MPAVESQFTDEDREDFVLAARYGDLDDVKAYMAQGINVGVKDNNGNTAMHMASANGHTDVLRELLTRADKDIVNMTNESGSTPLHWGALNGHLEVVKLLIEASADPDIRNGGGHSATFEALHREHQEVADYLLQIEEDNAAKGRNIQETTRHNVVEGNADDDGSDEGEEISLDACEIKDN